MANFVEVARLDRLPPGTGTSFKVADKDIAVFNVEGTIYAMDDSCIHAGASLGTGKLDGKIVTCRAHGLRYDVTSGSVTAVPGRGVATYEVKIEDGSILVAVA